MMDWMLENQKRETHESGDSAILIMTKKGTINVTEQHDTLCEVTAPDVVPEPSLTAEATSKGSAVALLTMCQKEEGLRSWS